MACNKRDTRYIILLTAIVICIYLPLNAIFTIGGAKWSKQKVSSDVIAMAPPNDVHVPEAKLQVKL